MINRFMDEVVSLGADHVLPQNLSSEWLNCICVSAKYFLQEVSRKNTAEEKTDSEILNDDESALLLAAVTELIHAQGGYESDITSRDFEDDYLFECLSCYSMLSVYVYLGRILDLDYDLPTRENVFDRDFIVTIEESNPQLTAVLHNFIFDDLKESGIN